MVTLELHIETRKVFTNYFFESILTFSTQIFIIELIFQSLFQTLLTEKKGQLISECIKGPLDAAFRSPLMKALDRSVKRLGL